MTQNGKRDRKRVFYGGLIQTSRKGLPAIIGVILSILAAISSYGTSSSAVPERIEIARRPAFLSTTMAAAPDKFSHTIPEHAPLTINKCASCHRPNSSLEPSLPKHQDCFGCHVLKFTGAPTSDVNLFCTICHTPTDLNSPNPERKGFSTLRTFNAKFDHAQHLPEPCTDCHRPTRGAPETLPAHVEAHGICYRCHVAGGSASNSSACSSCHDPGPYSPTSTNARAFRLSFSHPNHRSVSCQTCHTVRGPRLPQGKQVSSTLSIEHLADSRQSNCKTCHNDQRAFGDTDTHKCKRCHKREGFRM